MVQLDLQNGTVATQWVGSPLDIWQPDGPAVTVSEGDFVHKDRDGFYRVTSIRD